MDKFWHYWYCVVVANLAAVIVAEPEPISDSYYDDDYDTDRSDSGYGGGVVYGGGGCGVDAIAVACMGALALVGYAYIDLNNRLNTLNTNFDLVASDNNNFCTFFNTIETLADATTDAEAQARVNTIRDTAQAVNCETNRSG